MTRSFTLPLLCLPLALGGCARFPKTPVGDTPRLLTVRFAVKGAFQINDPIAPNYYFLLLNRTDNPNESGPAPVIAPPWGNGFAGPLPDSQQGFVAFVRYDRLQGGNNFGVYTCERNGVLANPATFGTNAFPYLGVPDRATLLSSNTIEVQIDLNRLPKKDAAYVQVNIIATNALPQGIENRPKYWDALGDGRDTFNRWVTIPIAQNGQYRNDITVPPIEPTDATETRDRDQFLVDAPDLDIVDWQITLLR